LRFACPRFHRNSYTGTIKKVDRQRNLVDVSFIFIPMRYYADLHIHSRFSRATSPQLTPEQLWLWAQIKGIQVVATGDCIHPGWLAELKEKLDPSGDGFFTVKPEYAKEVEKSLPPACKGPVRFILSTEISSIYKRDGKVRKVHNVVYMPDFFSAEKLAARLEDIGNIRSDGRPILGLDSRDLLDITLSVNPDSFLIPAHIWTPWFSVLGSKSGFNSIEECFGDLTKYIYALETGLSSDPLMNWRLSSLDKFVLVSNSDAHSPSKLGREANIFDTDLTYSGLLNALRNPCDKGLSGTVEFFPEEGKYHYDGHRKCETRMHPKETIKNKGLCPVCGKPVTVGVMARVEELADRPEGEKSKRWRPYHSMIPLSEIIGNCLGLGQASMKVEQTYWHCIRNIGSEFSVLLDSPIDKTEKLGGSLLAEGIRRVRNSEVTLKAGYDGDYGIISIFSDKERNQKKWQTSLFGDEIVPDFRKPDDEAGTDSDPKRQNKKKLQSTDQVEEKGSVSNYGPESEEETLKKQLNKAQQAAVDNVGSHLLIIAGPGTGKTQTLTHKIAKAAATLSGNERILAVTFTNKAAEEMRERISKLCDANLLERIFIGTFHQFCLSLLRQHNLVAGVPENFAIATDRQCNEIAAIVLPGSPASKRRDLLDSVSRIKSSTGETGIQETAAEIALYNRSLRESGLLDFDDLMLEALRMLAQNERLRLNLQAMYREVFVDEYQDINQVQHDLIMLLVQNGVCITAIGDPNQAIYGFRGSDARFFSSFGMEFPEARIVFLSENYRTASNLLEACGHVISAESFGSGVPSPVARLYVQGRLTVFEAATDKAEAEYVVHQVEKLVGGTTMFSHDSGRLDSDDNDRMTFSDFGVLYRTNAQSRLLIEAFERSGIPYRVSGEKSLAEYPIVKDILSFLSGAPPGEEYSNINEAFGAIETLPPFRDAITGNKKNRDVFERLKRIASLYGDNRSFSDYVLLQQSDDGVGHKGEKVSLLTLHAAKGLEFPAVFIVGCEKGLIPLERAAWHVDATEERRLFYVGMTRAKSRLYLVWAKQRSLFGKVLETVPSPYLADIKEEMKTYDKPRALRKIKKEPESEQISLFEQH
jgi:DNA helicase II / ATP-dependent DNA helicase PcrA